MEYDCGAFQFPSRLSKKRLQFLHCFASRNTKVTHSSTILGYCMHGCNEFSNGI